MLKYAFGSLMLFLVGIAAFLLWRTGYFKEVSISSIKKGPLTLVYQEHLGPYHKIPPVIEAVESKMNSLGTPCKTAFGLYLDDPNLVDHDRLRSQGGCLLESGDPNKFIESDLKTRTLPSREYIVATFNGSPSIGPWKVYPKVQEWMEKYGYKMDGPSLELYKTLPDESVLTTYLFGYK